MLPYDERRQATTRFAGDRKACDLDGAPVCGSSKPERVILPAGFTTRVTAVRTESTVTESTLCFRAGFIDGEAPGV